MKRKVGLCLAFLLLTGTLIHGKNNQRAWWQKPGLGIQYQIEERPGWEWGRDFEKFNQTMMDEKGQFKFTGPFCQVSEWVLLSQKVGVDYHIMEIKWHDGICYFNTKLTDWKTPEDYAGQFAKQSREQGIPFMYYYSTVFDHNPKFDSIQPNRKSTVSFIGMVPGKIYTDYLAGHFQEIMNQYHPDGFWLDWWMPWPDRSSSFSIKYLRENYPEAIITCNNSNPSAKARKILNYTSSEVHGLKETRLNLGSLTEFVTSLNGNGWKIANDFRQKFDHPWELISPAGQNWQIIELRPDLKILARISATVMANGGKSLIGVGTELSGQVIPVHQKQVELIGEWYKPRKHLFTEAQVLKYKGDRPPGVSGYTKNFGAVACQLDKDIILHLINFTGVQEPLHLKFSGPLWQNTKAVYLEPVHQKVDFQNGKIYLTEDNLDPIDTILRFEK